jgi:hypothetical protein
MTPDRPRFVPTFESIDMRGDPGDIVAFLRERYDDRGRKLDEDERIAAEAAQGFPNWDTTSDGDVRQVGTGGSGYLATGPDGGSLFEVGEHIARWDPARVLDQVADERCDVDAKRRILNEHVEGSVADGTPTGTCASCDNYSWPCPTVRLLAQPYASDPRFRDEWRVEPPNGPATSSGRTSADHDGIAGTIFG